MSKNIQDCAEYRLFCAEKLSDPYPLFALMRAEDPVHWSERMKLWFLTRYDDVALMMRDRRLSSSRDTMYEQQLTDSIKEQVCPLLAHLKRWLINLDPPDHIRFRRMLNSAFTPRLLDTLKPRIQSLADRFMASVPREGTFDFKEKFSLRFSIAVISEMLGVPEEHRQNFKAANDTVVAFSGRGGPEMRDHAVEANEALRQLTELFTSVIEMRKRAPRDDLISLLLSSEVDGQKLSDDMIVAFCVLFFSGGHETTAASINSGLLFLLEHPAAFAALRSDPESYLPTFIEEVFRFESASPRAVRLAKEDFELRGKVIRAGQQVLLLMGAANRDPEQFPNPDCFDIKRSPNNHIAFGAGPHVCIGAPLARIEMNVAFRTILNSMPHPKLAADVVNWRPLMGVRSIAQLPITFE